VFGEDLTEAFQRHFSTLRLMVNLVDGNEDYIWTHYKGLTLINNVSAYPAAESGIVYRTVDGTTSGY
jgi:hypothetical protein